eukprot:s806_g6.t1
MRDVACADAVHGSAACIRLGFKLEPADKPNWRGRVVTQFAGDAGLKCEQGGPNNRSTDTAGWFAEWDAGGGNAGAWKQCHAAEFSIVSEQAFDVGCEATGAGRRGDLRREQRKVGALVRGRLKGTIFLKGLASNSEGGAGLSVLEVGGELDSASPEAQCGLLVSVVRGSEVCSCAALEAIEVRLPVAQARMQQQVHASVAWQSARGAVAQASGRGHGWVFAFLEEVRVAWNGIQAAIDN